MSRLWLLCPSSESLCCITSHYWIHRSFYLSLHFIPEVFHLTPPKVLSFPSLPFQINVQLNSYRFIIFLQQKNIKSWLKVEGFFFLRITFKTFGLIFSELCHSAPCSFCQTAVKCQLGSMWGMGKNQHSAQICAVIKVGDIYGGTPASKFQSCIFNSSTSTSFMHFLLWLGHAKGSSCRI